MNIIVFASRFEDRNWKPWEIECTDEELDAVYDSAVAKARDRLNFGPPDLRGLLFSAPLTSSTSLWVQRKVLVAGTPGLMPSVSMGCCLGVRLN